MAMTLRASRAPSCTCRIRISPTSSTAAAALQSRPPEPSLVRTFPQREQDILSLKFDAELPNTQISEIMGLSEPNVRVIIFRTLRKLRDLISAERAR